MLELKPVFAWLSLNFFNTQRTVCFLVWYTNTIWSLFGGVVLLGEQVVDSLRGDAAVEGSAVRLRKRVRQNGT